MIAERDFDTAEKGQHEVGGDTTGGVEMPNTAAGATPPNRTDDHEDVEMAELGVLALLVAQLRELGEYVSYYVTAKTDIARLSLRNAVIWIVLAMIGFIVIAVSIITAIWLLLSGIAEGMSVLFGNRLWVGNIVTGVLLLVGLGLAAICTLTICRMTSRKRAVDKYEQRQARQKEQFGRSLLDQAEPASSRKV